MIDSFYVFKRPLLACRGCDKMLRGGRDSDVIVVLEYVVDGTLQFLCPSCASNRIILDHLAERLEQKRRQDVDNG